MTQEEKLSPYKLLREGKIIHEHITTLDVPCEKEKEYLVPQLELYIVQYGDHIYMVYFLFCIDIRYSDFEVESVTWDVKKLL